MRVLVVDDDQDVCRILATMLERRGHEVEVMHSGFGVTNRVAGRGGLVRPDAVVLDYMMPGLSGDKILQVLSQDPAAQDVPVVLFSASDSRVLEGIARIHPNCRAVQKGFGMRPLLDAVGEALAAKTKASSPTN